MEEIAFEEGVKKPTPQILDAEKAEMVEKAEKSITQAQIKQEIKQEVIETPIYDSVPKDLPITIFHLGSVWVSCPKFELDEKEADILSRHMSNLIGNPSSKIFSLLIILVVTFGKITACRDAIMAKLKPKTS